MKHENINWQLTSLEESKRLKELGVPQESLFYWRVGKRTNESIIRFLNDKKPGNGDALYFDWCSAFTVAELGEMLPYAIKKENVLYFLDQRPRVSTHKFDSPVAFYEIAYTNPKAGAVDLPVQEKTESGARAKMLIYLIENNLIEVK